jgi:O-Antigen ligase
MLGGGEEAGWKRYAVAHAIVLLGYLVFDRAFAWVHIPGIPLFAGEAVLLFGSFALFTSKIRPGSLIRGSLSLTLLIAYMTWGFLILASGVGDYTLDAIRDSTIWIYGLFALFLAISLLVRPVEWWLEGYQKALPWVLAWLPVSVILDAMMANDAPFIPDSRTGVFSHWSSNAAIHATIALAMLWAGPIGAKLLRYRIPLSCVAIITICIAGLSSRASFLATSVGGLILIASIPARRARLMWLSAGLLGLVLSLTILFEVEVSLWEDRGRSISAQQLADNVTSIVDPTSADENLRGTSEWRTGFWSRVVDDINNSNPVTGYGMGPNIREKFGEQDEDPPARNPHNSHLTILARTGWVGAVLWVLVWAAWYWELLRSRSRFRRAGLDGAAGLVTALMAGAAMYLVNGMFNEVVEGPHSAVWMWSIMGFGAFLSAARPRSADTRAAASAIRA